MNERDSEIISHLLSQYNYIETLDIDSADLIILNTCSIRAKAEQKVMSMLGYLRKNKKENPNLKICVTGCVAQQEGEALIKKMPHVNFVVGTQHIYDIPNLLSKNNSQRVVTGLSSDYSIPRLPQKVSALGHAQKLKNQPQFNKFVTIMQGCNNYCTYCVVPYTRGREISRKIEDIVDEVKVSVEAGVSQITLLGQNVNSYGLTNRVTSDGAAYSFPRLLHLVSQVPGLRRLRFTTSNPKDLSEDLMKCFRDIKSLCPQLHLPVQSGSNKVLRRMNRKYTIEKYYDLINTLRQYCPGIVLTTDIIVGFPGESEKDFGETIKLLEKVRFDGSFSFKYSDRPGTAAINLDGKVSEAEKTRRLMLFQKRQNQISLENNRKHIGKVLELTVESLQNNKYQCRAMTNHVVHVKNQVACQPGDVIKARIVDVGQHSFQGEAV